MGNQSSRVTRCQRVSFLLKEEQKVDRGTRQEVGGLPPEVASAGPLGEVELQAEVKLKRQAVLEQCGGRLTHQKEEEDWILEKEEGGLDLE